MTILYFTGTGNSLYAAKRIGGELVSIPQAVKENRYEFTDDKIGIIAPCYGFTVPRMVTEFLAKAKLNSPYIYLIVTYGNNAGDAAAWVTNYAAKCGINISYAATLLMIDNYLPQYDLREQYKMEKHTEESIDQLIADINDRKKDIVQSSAGMRVTTKLMRVGMEHISLINSPKEFSVSDACVGCGICTKVCPRGNIEIVDGKPVFHNSCEFCLGCVNNCSKKAIQMKRDKNKGEERYRNEHISVKEIIAANMQ